MTVSCTLSQLEVVSLDPLTGTSELIMLMTVLMLTVNYCFLYNQPTGGRQYGPRHRHIRIIHVSDRLNER